MSNQSTHSAPQKKGLLPWVTFIMMVLGISTVIALYWKEHLTIKEVEVVGNYFTSKENILAKAGVSIGQKPDSLDLDGIIKRIESLSYVKTASPYVEPDGNLRLSIHERTPIALLVNDDTRVYVDEDGVKLPIIEGKILDLPIVYGFNTSLKEDTLRSKNFEQIKKFLISARNNEFGWATISEIAFSKKEGVVALSPENGVKLVFGFDDFDAKLQNWEAFYSEVVRVKGIQTMQQVDLRFKNQVVTHES